MSSAASRPAGVDHATEATAWPIFRPLAARDHSHFSI
jgi:hypothetical protein